jgi:chromatin remodeling complex protein RSC6
LLQWIISPDQGGVTRRRASSALADDRLRKVFGKDKVTMFEMNKHLTQHLK